MTTTAGLRRRRQRGKYEGANDNVRREATTTTKAKYEGVNDKVRREATTMTEDKQRQGLLCDVFLEGERGETQS